MGDVPGSVAVIDQLAQEREAAERAMRAGDQKALPAAALAVFDRMRSTTERYFKYQSGDVDDLDAEDHSYAIAMGWRGVLQKYDLEGADLKRATAVTRSAEKFLNSGTVVESGGVWRVLFPGSRLADVQYEKLSQLPLPSLPGSSVTFGMSPGNHRNILWVDVPKGAVSSQPGGVGAMNWVRRHSDEIYRVGKGLHAYVLTRVDTTKRAAEKRERFVQFKGFGGRGPYFVTDPHKATKRIAYGIIYPPFAVDLQGEYATEKDVEDTAHAFLKSLAQGRAQPGEMHAAPLPGHMVESFVTRRGDPDFPIEGAWVGATEYEPEAWTKIVDGEYRGYSMAGYWPVTPVFGIQ